MEDFFFGGAAVTRAFILVASISDSAHWEAVPAISLSGRRIWIEEDFKKGVDLVGGGEGKNSMNSRSDLGKK